MHNYVLKECADCLAKPLRMLYKQSLCNSCNTGTRALPDIYALSPQAALTDSDYDCGS